MSEWLNRVNVTRDCLSYRSKVHVHLAIVITDDISNSAIHPFYMFIQTKHDATLPVNQFKKRVPLKSTIYRSIFGVSPQNTPLCFAFKIFTSDMERYTRKSSLQTDKYI